MEQVGSWLIHATHTNFYKDRDSKKRSPTRWHARALGHVSSPARQARSLAFLEDHVNVTGVGPNHALLQRCNCLGGTIGFLVDDNGGTLGHPVDGLDLACLRHVGNELLVRGPKVKASNENTARAFRILLLASLAAALAAAAPVATSIVGIPEHRRHPHHHPPGVEVVIFLHHVDEALVSLNGGLVQNLCSIFSLGGRAVGDESGALGNPLQIRNGSCL
mmetsp:Transcript_31687/g.56225  ORF Transcript_31687/g.56225 Transcript_31687/m.56225 type:complete len:219 (-) Transcript_31687:408-1064(-)